MDDMDERLKNELAVEGNPRAPRAGSASRSSRESADRNQVEDRELNEDDRLEMFRQTLFNDVLPDLPDIPGYHVCWLSTTHPSDTIPRRMRLGYTPVTAEEARGMEYATLKTGEHQGLIGVNEMVAFKLPTTLYQRFMQEAHHNEPARQASMIVNTVDSYKEQAARDGGEVMEGDGMQDLRRSAPSRGVFSG